MFDILIRDAHEGDLSAIWGIFRPIVEAGETYAFDPETSIEACQQLWLSMPLRTLVAESDGEILGTYYIKPNGAGPSRHICNCGYMVSPEARGRGLAGKMCKHSQELARSLGFRMMQFNAVVSTNTGAIRLWTRLGFEAVGRIPRAFDHPREGLVDTLVMVKWLEAETPDNVTSRDPAQTDTK